MLSNELYTGNVQLPKAGKSEVHYLSSNNNPAIISKEIFDTVQKEKLKRSNMVIDEIGSHRSKMKYSSKK